jgi:hypothetical protein
LGGGTGKLVFGEVRKEPKNRDVTNDKKKTNMLGIMGKEGKEREKDEVERNKKTSERESRSEPETKTREGMDVVRQGEQEAGSCDTRKTGTVGPRPGLTGPGWKERRERGEMQDNSGKCQGTRKEEEHRAGQSVPAVRKQRFS